MSTELRAPVRVGLHVGGHWGQAASGETFESRSPATGEVLGIVPYAGPEDGRRAIEAAGAARRVTAALGVEERARLCEAIAERIEARRDGLAQVLSLEQGKPYVAEAIPDIEETAENFRIAAEDVKRMESAVIPSKDVNNASSLSASPTESTPASRLGTSPRSFLSS